MGVTVGLPFETADRETMTGPEPVAGRHQTGELVLTVQDNGAGISQAGRRSGLANLAERASGLSFGGAPSMRVEGYRGASVGGYYDALRISIGLGQPAEH